MKATARLLVLLMLGTLVAGCLGSDASEPVEAAGSEELDHAPTPGMTRPDGRDGTFIAFEETNATEEGAGGLDHHHDMWQGRDRVTLVEQDVKMVPAAQGAPFARIRLPSDALVFEGTGTVEVHFSNPQRRVCAPGFTFNGDFICTDAATGTRVPDPEGGPAGLRLMMRHAATNAWVDAGAASWTEPLVIDVSDPRWTDMPHATYTLWGFEVRADDPALGTLTFDIRVDIVRAEGEIPLWPGHPEFYATSASRVVFDGPMSVRESGLSGSADAADGSELPVAVPERLVSYGTRALHVFANITSVTPTNPAETPSGWYLQYHNASGVWRSTEWTDPAHPGDMTEHVWVLHVDEDGMDSPYADGSRWGFRVLAGFGGVVVSCSGCASYEATYDLAIIATKDEAPAYDNKAPDE